MHLNHRDTEPTRSELNYTAWGFAHEMKSFFKARFEFPSVSSVSLWFNFGF